MKTILAAFLALFACVTARTAQREMYFSARDLPKAPATIESSGHDVLSPALRAAVLAKADYMGANKRGAVLRVSNIEAADPVVAIQSLNHTRFLSSVGSRTREFALLVSEPEISAVRRKPVDLLVRVKRKPASDSLAGLKITGWLPESRLVKVTKDGPISSHELEQLAANPDVVEYVEPNHIFSFGDPAPRPLPAIAANPPANFPDDPYFLNHGEWGMEQINAPALWQTATSADVVVAVIDTGVDTDHEDLKGNLLQGYNAIDGSTNTQDDNGHGTHCAGVIGGIGNNSRGIAGVNWHIKILPIKAFDASGLGGTAFQLASAFDYAIKSGAKVINASWGSPEYNDAIAMAVKRALAAGILVVAAAGNDSSDMDQANGNRNYPASLALTGLISVMAMDRTGAPAWFSNYGAGSVNLAAPGTDIISSWLSTDGGYKLEDGTSMAAPHVAGLAAALWSIGAAKLSTEPPGQAVRDLAAAILSMVKPSAALAGKCSTGGYLYYDPTKLVAQGYVSHAPPIGSPAPSSPPPSSTNPPTASTEIVKVTGKLEKGTPAIGGDSTGIVLRSNKADYELRVVSPEMKRKLLEFSGQDVTVTGQLKSQPTVERPVRSVLEITTVEKR